MHVFLRSLTIVVLTMCPGVSLGQKGEQTETQRVEQGELAVEFRDNSRSPSVLSGIDSLFNVRHAADYDAFDPDTRGASAGLNFEHIISGHQTPNNKFTPRHGPYTLRALPDGKSVVLTRRAEDCPWKVMSTLKYTVNEPYYIDFEFRCTAQDASLFHPHGYALFFFANYMNDVEDVSLHFRGQESRGAPEQWITADAPKGHPDWNSGGNYRALHAGDLPYDDDVEFRLNSWSYDWPRISRPFCYGRAEHDMTLILMFDRLYSDRDQIRFSLYKFKLPKHPRPAWDFQYVINRMETDEEYGFRGRLVWKKFVSPDDCLNEYERWLGELANVTTQQPAERVARLRQLGATVFMQGGEVAEVSANRTRISDEDLSLVSQFTQMTDLSLEETTISDAGLAHLVNMQKLQWLNLYRTRIGDEGLKKVSQLGSLQHLPVGETNVTAQGLAHLQEMKQLVYLGLRGNDVTDEGAEHLRELVHLTGLHLGGTKVTDAGLVHLLGLTGLQKLWLDETAITDAAIPTLGMLKSLRELHINETKITAEGVRRLTVLLPRCHIEIRS